MEETKPAHSAHTVTSPDADEDAASDGFWCHGEDFREDSEAVQAWIVRFPQMESP